MSWPPATGALGVVTVSSPDYIRVMLEALAAGRVTVPLRDAGDTERKTRGGVTEVATPAPGGGWIDGPAVLPEGEALAMISFTSGTTGTPKAVHLSQRGLGDVVTRLNAAMEVDDTIREYIGVPVYHSFGYGRARAALAAGGRAYIPEGGFDLRQIRDMLKAGEINAISAVPSLWRLFLQERELFGAELGAVQWVEIGSQYMSGAEKAALRAALPNARIVQHYGLTEASRSTFLRVDTAPEAALESVGQATGNVAVRIDEAGHICIRGPHVAMAIDEGDGPRAVGDWLVTSDLGRIEGDFLYYEGRADDVINCGGIKLVPDMMEAHLRREVPQAGSGFAVARTPDAMRGDGILLALEPGAADHRAALEAALVGYAAQAGLAARGAIVAREVEALPRTAAGKVQRKALAETLPDRPEAMPEDFMGVLEGLLGPSARDPGATFDSTGGDSLAHMQVTLTLERALGTAPQGWEWRPLAELGAEVEAAGDFAALMGQAGGAPPLPDGSRNENPPGISFPKLVAEDFRANGSDPFHQGFLMLLVHRFGNLRMSIRPRILRFPFTLAYRVLNKMTELSFGMKLSYTVKVGRRVRLEHFGGMILGAREIGDDVILRQNTTMGIRSTDDLNAKPVLGRGVDVGAGAVIVGNITVGDWAIVGANSVVFTNVPPGAVVMGVPAKVIGTNPRAPSLQPPPD